MKSFLFTVLFGSTVFAAGMHYSEDHRISLGGNEGWDWLSIDSTSDRLFVTRSNRVDVIDLKTEKVIGTISQSVDGAHGVAFSERNRKGYITSGKASKVIVFDLITLGVTKEIPTGEKPDAIAYDRLTDRVFAFNGKDKTATVIDSKTDKVLKTIKLQGKPEAAIADDRGHVYLNDEDNAAIIKIDADKMEVDNTWPMKTCKSPSGISADFTNHRVFSVCDNEKLVVTDSETGKTVKSLPIGKNPDAAAFDGGFVFSSNGAGTLTVVQEKDSKHYDVIENVETQKGARTMAVDPKTHNVYLITAKYDDPEPKSATNPNPRPKIKADTVELIVLKR